MVSIILTEMRRTSRGAPMSRTCIILLNVRALPICPVFVVFTSLTAKKEDNPEEALKEFRTIVDQETEKGDWFVSLLVLCHCSRCATYRGFKALKQSTKLLFLTLRRPSQALITYIQLLTYTKSAVTRNYSEKTINGILDYVGGGKGGPVEVDVLEQFYQATKDALEEAKNEVLSTEYTFFSPYLKIFVSACLSKRI